MKFGNSFKTAIIGLKTNKTRSALTILGIVIGISSVILMMSLGDGAQNLILCLWALIMFMLNQVPLLQEEEI